MTLPPRDLAGLAPEVFTLDEAAEILRVKKSWLERKAAARKVPFSMLGGSYHFSPDHLWQIFHAFEERPAVPAEPAPQPSPVVRRKRRPPIETVPPGIVPLRARPLRSRGKSPLAA